MPDTMAARYLPEKELMVKAKREFRTGFVAQEVEATAGEIGCHFDGVNAPKNPTDNYSIAYGQFVPSLVQTTQEQPEKIEDLGAENTEIKERLARLERMMARLNEEETEGVPVVSISDAVLQQNQPNPFTELSQIHSTIPGKVTQAELRITDVKGRILKTVVIDQRGEGQTRLQANSLSTGTYFYSLVLDGVVQETKKMVLAKK